MQTGFQRKGKSHSTLFASFQENLYFTALIRAILGKGFALKGTKREVFYNESEKFLIQNHKNELFLKKKGWIKIWMGWINIINYGVAELVLRKVVFLNMNNYITTFVEHCLNNN